MIKLAKNLDMMGDFDGADEVMQSSLAGLSNNLEQPARDLFDSFGLDVDPELKEQMVEALISGKDYELSKMLDALDLEPGVKYHIDAAIEDFCKEHDIKIYDDDEVGEEEDDELVPDHSSFVSPDLAGSRASDHWIGIE